MKFELIIENNGEFYFPCVLDTVRWSTKRRGCPGELNFSVIQDDTLNFEEGNPVRLKIDDKNVFYGFVFTKKRDKQSIIKVTAYDQLRYLNNNDTYRFVNKTASDIIKIIAGDFNLNLGTIENTGFTIPKILEDNSKLFDIIYKALDMELTNTKNLYIFYDDFGKLTLTSLENMKVDLIIDEETGQNYDYKSTIDEETYNKIKIISENSDTEPRSIYIAQDGNNINKWGILQYFDTFTNGEDGKIKADSLLSLYNNKTRNLKITKAFGDTHVRAGSMPVVNLNLGDVKLKNYMMVEKCTHIFSESDHTMDLHLKGGDFA